MTDIQGFIDIIVKQLKTAVEITYLEPKIVEQVKKYKNEIEKQGNMKITISGTTIRRELKYWE